MELEDLIDDTEYEDGLPDKNEHWDEFKCEERERAGEWDGHTPQEALQRMIDFLK